VRLACMELASAVKGVAADNYGIGLHWCANSIGALGGRIWATSEGTGRGASMHLMIPLTAAESVSTARVA
jgi:sensor histidine kinase regulating citrate/malate metabolism